MPEKPRPSMRAPTVLEQQGRVKPGMRAMTTGEKLAASGAGLYESDFDRAYMQQPLIAALMKSSRRLSEGWGEEPLDYLVQALDPSIAAGVLRPGTRLAQRSFRAPERAQQLSTKNTYTGMVSPRTLEELRVLSEAITAHAKRVGDRFPNLDAEIPEVSERNLPLGVSGNTEFPIDATTSARKMLMDAVRYTNAQRFEWELQKQAGPKVGVNPAGMLLDSLLIEATGKPRKTPGEQALEALLHEYTHAGQWVGGRTLKWGDALAQHPEWKKLAPDVQYVLDPVEVGARTTAARQMARLAGERVSRSYIDDVVKEINKTLSETRGAKAVKPHLSLYTALLNTLYDPKGTLSTILEPAPKGVGVVRKQTPPMRRGVKTP